MKNNLTLVFFLILISQTVLTIDEKDVIESVLDEFKFIVQGSDIQVPKDEFTNANAPKTKYKISGNKSEAPFPASKEEGENNENVWIYYLEIGAVRKFRLAFSTRGPAESPIKDDEKDKKEIVENKDDEKHDKQIDENTDGQNDDKKERNRQLIDKVKTDSKPAEKKKTSTLVVDMTDGTVTSRLKIQYGAGGMSLIRVIIRTSIWNFVIKAIQSVHEFDEIEIDIEAFFSNLSKKISKIFTHEDSSTENTDESKNTIKFTKAKKEFYTEFMSKFKSIETLLNDPEVKSLVYKIDLEKINGQLFKSTLDYLDDLHFVFLNKKGRVSIHALSNYIQLSQDIPVATKNAIIQSFEIMNEKIFIDNLQRFKTLDLNAKNKSSYEISEILAHFFKDYKNEEVYSRTFGDLTFEVEHGTNSHKDVFLKFSLFKFKGDQEKQLILDVKEAYFPLLSQYNLKTIVESYISNMISYFGDLFNSHLHVVSSAEQSGTNAKFKKHFEKLTFFERPRPFVKTLGGVKTAFSLFNQKPNAKDAPKIKIKYSDKKGKESENKEDGSKTDEQGAEKFVLYSLKSKELSKEAIYKQEIEETEQIQMSVHTVQINAEEIKGGSQQKMTVQQKGKTTVQQKGKTNVHQKEKMTNNKAVLSVKNEIKSTEIESHGTVEETIDSLDESGTIESTFQILSEMTTIITTYEILEITIVKSETR